MPIAPVPHADLGKGIDQFHPENKLADGFWQDIVNGDPTSSGSLSKRLGYQRYAGWVPIRVMSVSRSGSTLSLTLDASFDLTNLRSTPIFIYGQTSSITGDYATPNGKFYASFTVAAGSIQVTDSASGSYTDSAPQLSIWGIDWSPNIRAAGAGTRWGWVNHLDTYRSNIETRPICGLGGNLFAARTTSEVGATYGMSVVYPYRRGTKTSGTTGIGPALWTTGQTPARARGYVTASNFSGNWGTVTSAAYNSGTGLVDVLISATGFAASTTLSSIIETNKDWVQVQGVSTKHDGTWLVAGVSSTASSLTISVSIPAISDSSADTSGDTGQAGIFTDKIPLTNTAQFDVGDLIHSTNLPPDTTHSHVLTMSGNDIYVDGLSSITSLGAAEVFYGTGTSPVFFPRTSGLTQTITNFLRGDVLSISGMSRRVRVVNVNPGADRTVTISGLNGVATVQITSGLDTSYLQVGDILQIRGSTNYSGPQVISAVVDATHFQFLSTSRATDTGCRIPGYSVGLDEAISLGDDSANSTSLQPHARWIPMEYPTPASFYVPQGRTRHFDLTAYDAQNFIRSSMAQNNMYFTDGTQSVQKFDGTNITRAGLPRWQPFIAVSTIPSGYVQGVIANEDLTTGVTATSGSAVVTCTAGDEAKITVGNQYVVKLGSSPTTGQTQLIAQVKSTASGVINLSLNMPGSGAATMYPAMNFKYYFRLNLVDANQNVVASAMTSSQDVSVIVGTPSAVQLQLAGFPRFPGFDFARLQLQIFRTPSNGSPPYFHLATIPLKYTSPAGYISYIDTLQSIYHSNAPINGVAQVPTGPLDPVASVLTGAELGTGWEGPPPSKYMSSMGGRLLLANITDYQQMDVSVRVDPYASPSLFSASQYLHQKKFYLRKNGSSATVTDMQDAVVFECLEGVAASAANLLLTSCSIDVATDGSSFTLDGFSSSAGVSAGDWIHVYSATLPPTSQGDSSMALTGWWQVYSNNGGAVTCRANLPPSLAFDHTQVNTTDDSIAFVGSHGLTTGAQFHFHVLTGSMPSGLHSDNSLGSGREYYAIITDNRTIKCATSLANAIAGTAVDITTTGTGTYHLVPGSYITSNATSVVVVRATNSKDVPVLLFEGNYANEERGYNTRADQFTDYSTKETQFVRKLAHAVNSVMGNYDPGESPNFSPFVVAGAGNDYSPGQLVLRRPRGASDFFSLEHSITKGIQVFFNSSLVANGVRTSATQRVFPSRILRSYPNYPEIFDSPTATLDTDSDSAIDVNPSDGQQLTGLQPFYGDATFGAQQQEQVLLAFKERSVYAVNPETKQVQKLTTYGQGCTFPRSIAPTKDGVIFANDSGLWKINSSMKCVWIGQIVKRIWDTRRSTAADTDVVCGTHSYLDRMYKLSYPVGSDLANSEVLTYDHTREFSLYGTNPEDTTTQSQLSAAGAWSRYDNHPATWWCNTGVDSLFGTTGGLVYSIRRAGDVTDYRDDASPVHLKGTYKAVNFGTSGVRKLLSGFVASFRVAASMVGTVIRAATELLDSFGDLDSVATDVVTLQGSETGDDLSDLTRGQIRSLLFAAQVNKGNYFQVQIENDQMDEPVELTQLDFLVETLSHKGLEPASQSGPDNSP